MVELSEKPGLVTELLGFLKEQVSSGQTFVVFDSDIPISSKFDLTCFPDAISAFEFEAEHLQIFNWHQSVPIIDVIYQLKQIENYRLRPDQILINPKTSLKTNAMNLNNLEDRKEEMAQLGASAVTIAKMEEQMKAGATIFKIHQPMPANKGQVDVEFHFQQSKQSDNYYLNRFTVAHNLGKPLEEGQQYMIISPNPAGKGNLVKNFELVTDAIEAFKKREGVAELAIGKDAGSKLTVATMEEGKVNSVAKSFRASFYGKPATQTIWPDKGKGFTVEQSAQMIQGYSVFRNDLVNFSSGEVYAAWVKFDMDKGVAANGNFNLQQFHVPQYGFDLSKVLDNYAIKELSNPDKRERLEADLRNGMTPLVTVEKDSQPLKLLLEAVPRYSKVNFYSPEGTMEKREQFMTKEALTNVLDTGQEKGKNKDKQQETGIGIGA